MQRVVAKIDTKTGLFTLVDMFGFGEGCVHASAELERKLGKPMESTRVTTEQYGVSIDHDIHIGE